MSTPEPSAVDLVVETLPPRKVSVAILFVHEDELPDTIAAVRAQVYETTAVTVVGGGSVGERMAGEFELGFKASFPDLVSSIGSGDDYVWIVHGDAYPRRDSLGALVFEAERNDAGMVGSKILDAANPDLLEAVGSATDVFGEPYTGLDPGEVDLEQYDVVRDVAYVSGVCLLVRRDLLKGLGGTDPKLPPESAGHDFSQRARVAGARVMVAPSSEVLHSRRCGHDVATWRELAGRQRAMMKAYRWITLLWVIPLGLILGLLDGFAGVLLGRPGVLRNVLLAVGWNIYHMPSTLIARRAVASVRVTRDEELFRYQVSGSIRLRSAAASFSERFGWVIDEEAAVITEEDLEGNDGHTASIIVSLLGVIVVALAARQLWFGSFPASGFALPASGDWGAVLRSYAGGWNPSGLGSPEPMHPAAVGTALIQAVLFGWSGAQSVLAVVSMLAGYFGIGRLARRLGVTGAGRHLGGVVYLLGPFAMAISGASYWPGVIALGGVPIALDAILAGRRWFAKIGLLILAMFLAVPFAPLTGLVLGFGAITGWMITKQFRWTSILWAMVGVGAGALLIGPTLVYASIADLWSEGPTLHVGPGQFVAVLILVLALASVIGARSWRIAAWAGLLVATALAIPLIPDVGAEPLVAAAIMGSLGLAVLVAAAFEPGSSQRWIAAVAAIAATAVVFVSLAPVPGGQVGLPDDEWGRRLAFVQSLSPSSGPDRILLVGRPSDMPGEWRVGDGFAYRLINGGRPSLDEMFLPAPRLGDETLAAAIDEIVLGSMPRPGSVLARFAIRWVVVIGDVPINDALGAQVDLKPIPVSRDVAVYENLAAQPRAVSNLGTAWKSGLVQATGPAATGRLRIADNADPDWGPLWSQNGWSNEVSTVNGVTSFAADPERALTAWVALILLGLAVPLAIIGRKEKS